MIFLTVLETVLEICPTRRKRIKVSQKC